MLGTVHSFPYKGLPVLHMVHIMAQPQQRGELKQHHVGEGRMQSIRKSLKASTMVPLICSCPWSCCKALCLRVADGTRKWSEQNGELAR